MITTVLFDLFETLVTESHSTPTRASSLGPALGLDRAAFKVQWKARRHRVTLGQLSFRDALSEISRTLIGRVNEEAVQHACEQRLGEKVVAFARRDPGVEQMIHELRARDIKLGVISNGFTEDVHAWLTWPLAPVRVPGLLVRGRPCQTRSRDLPESDARAGRRARDDGVRRRRRRR